MAIRTTIPWALTLVRLESVSEVLMVNSSPDIERSLARASGWLGASLHRLIEADMLFDDTLLHVFRKREDGQRADAQKQLRHRLGALETDRHFASGELQEMALYVRGTGTLLRASIASQQLFGRLFVPSYRASVETWRAASHLDSWPRRLSPLQRPPWDRARLEAAKSALLHAADGNLLCVHATGLAVHNLVRSLTRMRARARTSREYDEADALVAPRTVLRAAARKTAFPFLRGEVQAGTLFMLELEKLYRESLDPRMVFLEDQWSACPAALLVRKILARTWNEAMSV